MQDAKLIEDLKKYDLKLGLDGTTGASWHSDFKDSAYIFYGGLPFELTE
eukprot:gene16618-711_t